MASQTLGISFLNGCDTMSIVYVPFGVWAHIPKRLTVSPPNPFPEHGEQEAVAIQPRRNRRFEPAYATTK
jgi:hypothetical protein